jgi:hypothetical protein
MGPGLAKSVRRSGTVAAKSFEQRSRRKFSRDTCSSVRRPELAFMPLSTRDARFSARRAELAFMAWSIDRALGHRFPAGVTNQIRELLQPLAEQQRDLQAVNQLLNECVEVFRLHRGAPSCGSIEAPDTMAGATRLALSELMVRGSSAWFRRWRVPVSERPSMSLYWWSEGCRRRSRPVERSSRASGATGRSPRRWWLVARDVPNIPCLT